MANRAKTGGRRKGTPNKATEQGRALFKQMLEGLALEVEDWIRKTAKKDPKGAAELTLKLAEFCIPRWQRITVDLSKMPLEDIAAELARREAEAAAAAPVGQA
jgi:hypothetical protein